MGREEEHHLFSKIIMYKSTTTSQPHGGRKEKRSGGELEELTEIEKESINLFVELREISEGCITRLTALNIPN